MTRGFRSAPGGSPTLELGADFGILVNSIKDYAIFLLNPQGRVMSWNTGARRLKGYEESEILGESFLRFYTPTDIEAGTPQRLLQTAAREGRVESEGWRVRKDGSLFWADVVISAIRSEGGQLVGFVKVTRDLTERRASEEALREDEQRTRLLIDSVKDYAIIMLDREGRIESWNSGAERLKGYQAEEIIGQPMSRFYTTEDNAGNKPARLLAVALAEGRVEDEGWRVRKDGSLFWADVVITPIRDAQGGLKGYAKVTRDLTERQEIEQHLLERSAALIAANRELEAFSYSVSHDLRAPLRAMDGFSRAIQREYGDQLPGRGQEYLDRIQRAAGRMSALIDDLLNLSRITRTEIRRQSVDLSSMAADVIGELRRHQPERRVDTTVEPGMKTNGDQRLLRLVLDNLIGNAWKFSSRRTDARIEVGSIANAGHREFFVRDNGAGFNMAYVDKLFAPFQRLHRDTEFEGTGIGLATVHRIITRHGGRVWVEAEPDKGATFWFTTGAIS